MTRGAATSSETAIAVGMAMRHLRARLRQESQPSTTELSLTQVMALGRVVKEGALANAALAASEHMRPQSMHEIVSQLAARGLIERRADPQDGRKLLIDATPAGRRIVDDITARRHDWLAGAIDDALSPAERKMLLVAAELLERVAAASVRAP